MKKYLIRYNGEFRYADEKGQISRENWNASEQWVIIGIAFRSNAKSFMSWSFIKSRLDNGEKINGFVFDRDHGTLRQWGNGKAEIQINPNYV